MQNITPPDAFFGPLLNAVAEASILSDGKAFADAIAKEPMDTIIFKYNAQKDSASFDLKGFIETHFQLAEPNTSGFESDATMETSQHIERLWDHLLRQPDQPEISTRIPLPHPYIVPGGRFGEIYYWDSYFTMLGLQISGKIEIIQSMIDNFCYMIDVLGHVPNGTRSYFMGRSQPPYLSWMVRVLAEAKGAEIWQQYGAYLEKEYAFWMKGAASDMAPHQAQDRVVRLPEGILNRYWDNRDGPREEMYGDDLETAEHSKQDAPQIYKHLRAGAESGWDFTARWFEDSEKIETIVCSDIIPVDLNALLYDLEITLAQINSDNENGLTYEQAAKNRKKLILKYCWNTEKGFFYDYNFRKYRQTSIISMAGLQPLFSQIPDLVTGQRALKVAEKELLKPGGMVSSTVHSGQQWDAPNGWAPLQWVGYKASMHYERKDLAIQIAQRWKALNDKTFKATGKMMEKYNVEDLSALAGGGEYPVQDGFGWTNGVYLALTKAINNL